MDMDAIVRHLVNDANFKKAMLTITAFLQQAARTSRNAVEDEGTDYRPWRSGNRCTSWLRSSELSSVGWK